jgi:hypothetical protein
MCHESFDLSGECFLVGAGRMARLFLGVAQGYISETGSAEDFAEHLGDVMNLEGYLIPANRGEEFASYLPRLGFDFASNTVLVNED